MHKNYLFSLALQMYPSLHHYILESLGNDMKVTPPKVNDKCESFQQVQCFPMMGMSVFVSQKIVCKFTQYLLMKKVFYLICCSYLYG